MYLKPFVGPTVDLIMAVEKFVAGQGLALHQVRNQYAYAAYVFIVYRCTL